MDIFIFRKEIQKFEKKKSRRTWNPKQKSLHLKVGKVFFIFQREKASQFLNSIMQREWKHTDRKLDFRSRFKSKLDPAESVPWDIPARVDPSAAKLSTRSFFPADDSALLKDPMDRKAEFFFNRSYCVLVALNKSAIASLHISRALLLSKPLRTKHRRGHSKGEFCGRFLCDFPLDVLKNLLQEYCNI